MMYEHAPTGLGWETLYETTWYGGQTENPKRCIELAHRGVPGEEAEQRCFKSTTPEQSLAIQSECERIGWACETSGEDGSAWCCPPGRPDRQLRAGEVVSLNPETPAPPPSTPPRPGPRRSFFGKLTHPGALAAIGLVGVVGFLGYRMFRMQESRGADV